MFDMVYFFTSTGMFFNPVRKKTLISILLQFEYIEFREILIKYHRILFRFRFWIDFDLILE